MVPVVLSGIVAQAIPPAMLTPTMKATAAIAGRDFNTRPITNPLLRCPPRSETVRPGRTGCTTNVRRVGTCSGSQIVHADGTVADCSLDHDTDGCAGRERRHEGGPRAVSIGGSCNYCGKVGKNG